MSDSKMIEITGLWINETRETGERYFSGYLGNAKVLIFKNKFKEPDNPEHEKQPDYRMYLAEKQKKENIPF